jgi:ribose transport system permease protein
MSAAGGPQIDPSAVLPEDADISEPSRWQRFALGSTTSILLILIAMIVVFSALEFSSFATVDNLRNVTTDASVLLVLAVGMTFVIITAGIGRSVRCSSSRA